MSKICFGCGAHLQSVDEDKLGFVPKEKHETSEYCQRCFKLMHYGVVSKDTEPKSIKSIINSVNKNAKFVVFLTDFINIFDESMNIFKEIKTDKILVISKSDIIPTNISYETIKYYLKKVYKITSPIIFTSNKTNLNTFTKAIYGKDEIYFLGLTNAGKSSLINMLINKNTKKLTTSYKENTTKDFVRIKLDNMTLIDSPGFVVKNFELDKYSNIKNKIKPITYQNKDVCTYSIGNYFSIKFQGKTNLVFYFSNDLKITRLYNKELVGTTFLVKSDSDIVITGLGFIKVTEDVRISLPSEIMPYLNIRKSLTGGKF